MLAIVPARGGSKGIKRKNLRLLHGKPLIFYVLRVLKQCKYINDIVVTTDDNEIIEYISQLQVLIRKRPDELAKDDITLDPVIYDAIIWYETNINNVNEFITVQPTSPLITPKTINNAIEIFFNDNIDCLISAIDNTHLTWRLEENVFVQNYEKRVNRQWLPQVFKETGAYVISKRKLIENGSRIGGNIKIDVIPEYEGIDIDKPLDWLLCEALLKRMSIYFIVIGDYQFGMGHVRRALTLANYWLGHDIIFIGLNLSDKAKKTIIDQNFILHNVNNPEEVFPYLNEESIVINDILDTEYKYVAGLKEKNVFVINFEDLGDGADEAHLVINALYERSNNPENHLYGYKYECLDERFLIVPANQFNEICHNILITFGGTDPSNLTLKTIEAFLSLQNKCNIKIVLGPAFIKEKELFSMLYENNKLHNFEVFSDVSNMAAIMKGIDLAITSNGRTIFELAAMGIPMISMAQNERESLHLFARYSKGVKYLGVGDSISCEHLSREIENIIDSIEIRREMYENLPIDHIRKGLYTVTEVVENSFRRWKNEKNNNWQSCD